jgi:aerobic carbon-monoxide dehydrogenase medium subunit
VKPPPFTYHRPESRDEVDTLLSTYGPDAKILAGGQSLVPILNMRLASPAHVIDINHLREEANEPEDEGDAVVFGPLVRQETVERSALVSDKVPLLAETIEYVAHGAIRNRGTVVGSVAHADPAAELPAVLVALGGTVMARRSSGRREIAAAEFFSGPLENAMGDDEWAEGVRWPARAAGEGFAFTEFARRAGDYALCGVAAVVRGSPRVVTLAYLGMGDVPVALDAPLDSDSHVEDAVVELTSSLDAAGDIHATPQYRGWLARKLGTRAARAAVAAAEGGSAR